MRKWIVTVLLILLPSVCVAAVTFDSRFEKSGSSTTGLSFVSNAGTNPGTVGNNPNRVLIGVAVFSHAKASMGTVAMTWNSVSMTAIDSEELSGSNGSVYVFGLIAPDIGNQTLAVTFTGGLSTAIYLGAVSVYNADQSTGWQNVGTDTGTSQAPSSTVTTANGNMAIVSHGDVNASTIVINQGTSAWIDNAVTNNAAQCYVASVGATAICSWTLGTSVNWRNIKLDVIAASTASAGPYRRRTSYP